jgi:hypothetical protein
MGFEIVIYILRWVTKLIGKICDLPPAHPSSYFMTSPLLCYLQGRDYIDAIIGGGGVRIHIFVFCPTDFFWKRLFLRYVNINIWICTPTPIIASSYGPGYLSTWQRLSINKITIEFSHFFRFSSTDFSEKMRSWNEGFRLLSETHN